MAFMLVAEVSLGQLRYENFESGLPADYSASSASTISISNNHKKSGANSLQWNTKHNEILSINNLQIPAAEIYNYSANSAQFWIYSKAITNDTLVFKFYDNTNALKREARIVLNYKGWRDFHRSYRYDYNKGTEQPGFILNKITVTYRGYQGNTESNQVFFDEMTYAGNGDTRIPGPHNGKDYLDFRFTSNYTQAILAYNNQPDMPLSAISPAELSAIENLKVLYKRTVGSATLVQIAEAKNYVNALNITLNTDGTLNGRGIYDIYKLDTLLKVSNYVSYLSRAYVKNNDTDALAKLNSFLSYLIDQGLAEGGRIVIPYNDYSSARNFPIGFLEAIPLLTDQSLREKVVKLLKWSHEFNTIYNTNPVPGLEMDFLHIKSNFLVELALLENTNDEIARDLKSFGRYLEQFTYSSAGARDGIKVDGVGFHHNSQHISYQYAYGTWISRAFELKGTPFKISQTAYQNMSRAIKTLFLETSKGAFYPNSASGRGPFPSSVPVNAVAFDRLVQVGGDLIGESTDPEMARFYNYVFQENKYPVTAANYDGYYQLNYAQTGIMRKNNWIAVSRGLTDRMFGAEIYAEANRYGRYQSYGALEVLYDGSLTSTGYIAGGAGWDWNMMPGATTVKLSYENLKPIPAGTASEYQADAFAGALADGNTGVFGMNFVENAGAKYVGSNLKFRKSVFTFDSLMVCLGSTISATNSADPVITTLFQGVNAVSNPSIYINSATPVSSAYDQAVSTTTNGLWLVNGQTTGYYIPKGNGDVNIFRGTQTTPLHTTNNVSSTASANVSKAWFAHGVKPTASKYQYVVVPATSPQKMDALSTKIAQGELYQVLKQTDSVHAVKYIPDSSILYSCFLAQPNINTGFVKGISGRALLAVREKGRDTLVVKIANPDLNATENAESTWISAVSEVTVSLKGNWRIAENTSNAGIVYQDNQLDASFSLKDGFAQTLILVNDDLTEEEHTGVWDNQSQQWVYDLTTGTGLSGFGTLPTYQQGSSIVTASYSHSMSSAGSSGFLPYPPTGTSRVHIVNAAGGTNGTIVLNPDGTLKMSASAVSGINKVSAYSIDQATPVASMFFTIAFNSAPTNGTFIWAIGNRGVTSNTFSNANSVYKSAPELFAALQWNITASGINFNFRESADGTGGTYKLISNSAFKKGENYDVEVYANNSSVTEHYTRNGEHYELPAGKLNIWVKPHGKLVRASRLIYNGSAAIGASGEMVSGVVLNSYLFQGASSTQPSANAAEITLANMEMNYAKADPLPVSMLSFEGKPGNNAVLLNWIAVSEKNTSHFVVYRSTDGLNFKQIATVAAAGNSSEALHYSFSDSELPLYNQQLYYRLVLIDKDDVISYESTIVVKLSINKSYDVLLYPNPVHQMANINVVSPRSEVIKVVLTDLLGKVLFSRSNNIVEGENQISIDVSGLPAGAYVLLLQGQELNKRMKFLKL